MSKVTKKEILIKAAGILQQKLDLEEIFEKDIKQYFSKCVNAVRNGSKLPTSELLIRKNADRIVNTIFKNHPDRVELKSKVIKGNEKLIKKHYKSIDSTNNDKYTLALQTARDMLNEPEHKANTTSASLNKTAANIFQQSSNNRIQTINITEVSSIHNKSRINTMVFAIPIYNDAIDENDDDEADDITDLCDSIQMDDANDDRRKLSVAILNQTWVCMFANSCEICEGLDGQQVPLGQSFEFDGEYYDVPGDPHVGCNCDIVY